MGDCLTTREEKRGTFTLGATASYIKAGGGISNKNKATKEAAQHGAPFSDKRRGLLHQFGKARAKGGMDRPYESSYRTEHPKN